MKTNFDEQLFQLGLTILQITVAVGNCSRHRSRGSRTVIFFGLQCSAIGQLVATMVLPAVVKPGWVYMLTYGTTQHISPSLGVVTILAGNGLIFHGLGLIRLDP